MFHICLHSKSEIEEDVRGDHIDTGNMTDMYP
jgi:hypothetical protein